jgi:hypothetical protein
VNVNKTEAPLPAPTCPTDGLPLAVKVGMSSAFLVVALRAYHTWTVACNTGALPAHLFAIFLLCACVAVGLTCRSTIAWYAARILAGCGMVLFTLGVIYITFQFLRGNIQPPAGLLLLTFLNPTTAGAVFFSLGRPTAREHFARNEKVSPGIMTYAAIVGGLALTTGLVAGVAQRGTPQFKMKSGAGPSVAFEIRETAQQLSNGCTAMVQKVTGETIFVHSRAVFSNGDIRGVSVDESTGPDGQSVPVITVIFTDEATERFAAFTAKNIDRSVAILVGGEVWWAPIISDPMTAGRCFIPFRVGEKDEAERIAKGIVGH